MPNKKLQTLYDNIKAEYDLPDYAAFESDMNDPVKRQRLHATLVTDNFEVPDFNTFSNDILSPEVKKKESAINGVGEVSISSTKSSQPQPTSPSSLVRPQVGINDQFNIMSLRGDVAPPIENKFVKKYSSSDVTDVDRKEAALKVLKNSALGIGVDVTEAEKVIDAQIKKNPKQFDELGVSYKEKSHTNDAIKESSVDELIAYGDERIKEVRDNQSDYYDFKQSKPGKVYEIINSVKGGDRISDSDAEYLKNNAPTSYNELLQSVEQYSPDYPIQNINSVSEIMGKQNQANFIKSANEDVVQSVNYITSISDFNDNALGTDEVVGELSKVSKPYELQLKELNKKYPQETYRVKTADGYDTRYKPLPQEYYDQKEEIDAEHNNLIQGVAKASAYKFATEHPQSATSETVG